MLDRPNPPCYNSIVVQAEQQLKKMLNYVSIADFSKKSTIIWGYSSAGRALEWHSRGQRFDPAYLHHEKQGKLRAESLGTVRFQGFSALSGRNAVNPCEIARTRMIPE